MTDKRSTESCTSSRLDAGGWIYRRTSTVRNQLHDRLKDWEKLGVWKKVMDAIVSYGYVQRKLSIDKVAIDSSDIQAKKGEKRRIRRKQAR